MRRIKIASVLLNENNVERIQGVLKFDASLYDIELVYDEENPDYVLTTNHIYTDKRLFNKLKKYLLKDCILIYFTYEYCNLLYT